MDFRGFEVRMMELKKPVSQRAMILVWVGPSLGPFSTDIDGLDSILSLLFFIFHDL